MKLTYTVTDADDSKTVKQILKNRLLMSERLVKRLKYACRILCNSVPVHVNAPVFPGDIIEADIGFDDINEDILPERMELEILFEDDSLIALNKPPFTVVHPTSYHPSGTMANGIMHYLLEKGARTRVRPVSRLDRNTSGIIIFALNQYVQEKLVRQMHDDKYYKEYIGIVHGNMEAASGVIDLPIERKPGSIMLRHISSSGYPSVTRYEVLERLKGADYVRFILETGRTHQIRVHCQATGHPLLGDTLYPYLDMEARNKCSLHDGCNRPYDCGASDDCSTPADCNIINRQALHSYRTIFEHPISGRTMSLAAPVPSDISKALEILKK